MAQMRNVRYVELNPVFRASCAVAHIEATPRQASKWRAQKGQAWKAFSRMPLYKKTAFLKEARREGK